VDRKHGKRMPLRESTSVYLLSGNLDLPRFRGEARAWAQGMRSDDMLSS
jgi:hypothetical protein